MYIRLSSLIDCVYLYHDCRTTPHVGIHLTECKCAAERPKQQLALGTAAGVTLAQLCAHNALRTSNVVISFSASDQAYC